MNIDYKLIGKRIQSIRKRRRLTQEQLSEQLGVTVGYISQVERGVTRPNLEMLAGISERLQCELTHLITGSASAEPRYLASEFLDRFARLSARERRVVLAFIESLRNY